jgi:2'-5' RNA ligase
MRVFVAIPVSEEVKNQALQVTKELAGIDSDIKWVEYENYHITLKFLGEIRREQLMKIKEKLAFVAQACPEFILKTNRIGFFPNKTRPRVMWVGVKGELNKAQFLGERVDTYLGELGFEAERKRSFHLTLGRIRSERNIDELLYKTANINSSFKEQDVNINEFNLMESRLSSDGPRYTILENYRLQG